MRIKQWTIEDFQKNKPIYEARVAELAMLGFATWPFTVGAIYWLGCILVKPMYNNPSALMWISLVGGTLLSASVCAVVLEWLKAFHYKKIRQGDDALGHCGTLLAEALRDRALVDQYLSTETNGTEIGGLESNETGVDVVRCEDEKVFLLIDQWIRKRERGGGAGGEKALKGW